MAQTKQDKRGVWLKNFDNTYGSDYPNGDKAPNSEGSPFTIVGSFGTNAVTKAFSDPLIRATNIDSTPANGQGIVFNQTAGWPFVVKNDPVRGKVLFNTQDDSHYNSALRYFTSGVPENTWIYFGHWTKVNLGSYSGYVQLKNDRWNVADDINDGSGVQIKLHAEVQNGIGGETSTLLINEGDPNWSLGNQYGGIPLVLTDNEWFFLDGAIFTGTQGGNDARVIRRILKGGQSFVIENITGCRIYNDLRRYIALILQAYLGNWGPTIQTANTGPAATTREISRSSLCVIHSKMRIDLSNNLDTSIASWRHNLDWDEWNNDIDSVREYPGLPAGTHTIYARVIDGYTSSGWDNVIGSTSWVVTK